MTRYPLSGSVDDLNIALHPCQRLITLNGVDLVAFFLRQFHIGKNGFSIRRCGTPTDGPYARTIAVCHCVVAFFFVQKLVESLRADAPAPISAKTAADRPYLIFVFIDIYDEDARAYWQDFQS